MYLHQKLGYREFWKKNVSLKVAFFVEILGEKMWGQSRGDCLSLIKPKWTRWIETRTRTKKRRTKTWKTSQKREVWRQWNLRRENYCLLGNMTVPLEFLDGVPKRRFKTQAQPIHLWKRCALHNIYVHFYKPHQETRKKDKAFKLNIVKKKSKHRIIGT